MNRQSAYNSHRGKFLKKFLNSCVDAFAAKKYMRNLQQFVCEKNLTLPSGKKFFKKIASRCDSSKILDANKLYIKLDRVIPALVMLSNPITKIAIGCNLSQVVNDVTFWWLLRVRCKRFFRSKLRCLLIKATR